MSGIDTLQSLPNKLETGHANISFLWHFTHLNTVAGLGRSPRLKTCLQYAHLTPPKKQLEHLRNETICAFSFFIRSCTIPLANLNEYQCALTNHQGGAKMAFSVSSPISFKNLVSRVRLLQLGHLAALILDLRPHPSLFVSSLEQRPRQTGRTSGVYVRYSLLSCVRLKQFRRLKD
jgi:hypothetical protein